MAGYGIPVTFHDVMSVVGSNSLANSLSFTPGAVGVTQAANATVLADSTDSTTATAYSLGRQVITTTYNQILAIGLLVWAVGWTGGKLLVRTSYSQAKDKVEEQKIARAERKSARDAEAVDEVPRSEMHLVWATLDRGRTRPIDETASTARLF